MWTPARNQHRIETEPRRDCSCILKPTEKQEISFQPPKLLPETVSTPDRGRNLGSVCRPGARSPGPRARPAGLNSSSLQRLSFFTEAPQHSRANFVPLIFQARSA